MGNTNPKTLAFLLAVSIAVLAGAQGAQCLGVTRPVPYDVELLPGETAGFTFQIQAVTSTEDLDCVYSISGMNPLVLEFEEDGVVVAAGTISNVYGTVTAPEDAEKKTYGGSLTVSCGPLQTSDVGGSVVRTTIGGSPFNVNVVDVRERDIREISPPDKAADYTSIIIIAAIIIIIIVAIGVYYWYKKRRRKKGKEK
jgi:hypothetical protein